MAKARKKLPAKKGVIKKDPPKKKSKRISTGRKKSGDPIPAEKIALLNLIRSSANRSVTSTETTDLRSTRDEKGREIFTGRHIISLNRTTRASDFEKLSRKASLRIVSLDELPATRTGRSANLLKESDGVVLPHAGVALMNPDLEDQISFLTSSGRGKGMVNYIEPERFVYPALAKARRNALFSDSKVTTWGLQATNVIQAAQSGAGIRVAVLDTGLNLNHPDFKQRSITSSSFIDDEDIGDFLGHGTMCAGIICGERAGSGPRYGVAQQIQLFIGKVIAKTNKGTDTSLLDGIEWALANKCHIINLSVVRAMAKGETGFSQTYEILAAKALANNTLIIAAAGNESDREFHVIKPVAEPANCPSIMAVAAIDENIQVANFSCGGLFENGGAIDISGPGVNVLSTHLKSSYKIDSGTSFACPYVVGIAALIWQETPAASAFEIWTKLVQNAKRLELKASDVGSGLAFLG